MRLTFAAVMAVPLLASCVSMPTGPGVMALPGNGKSFDQFRADDLDCRQFASSQVGGAEQAAQNKAVENAAVGTAVGALAGALIGGHQGAGVGAATGLVIGGTAGAGSAAGSQHTLQQRYDIGYTQCMYSKGHQVPMAGRAYAPRPAAAYYAPPPPPPPGYGAAPPYGAPPPSANTVPPPPPGTPPPPPPGVR